jgi:branched-chain amino acid transport system substrate-binding protein
MSTKGITTTITVVLAIVMLVVGLVVGYLLVPIVAPVEVGLSGDVELGGLFSLTGDLATFGENEQVAAELAVDEVNDLLEDMGEDWTLKLVSEDTQTDPDLALEKLESLAARGVKLIVGPLSSGEVRSIKSYCDANNILAISQSSTAADLSIEDDNIFRFCPTDKVGQGPAIGRIMYDDGQRYIIPVTRNDAWGKGLEDYSKEKFEELGGTFLQGILYDPEAAAFTTEAADLASKVDSAITTYGADKVAILNIAFEEVVTFMTACLGYPVLDDVKWYGSDGTATSGAMLDDADVRDFSMSVDYPCTIFGPTHSEKWEKVRDHGSAELGREPESYSYAIYDIVWVYTLCLLAVDDYDAMAIKGVLPTIAEAFFGASGWVQLDKYGDRGPTNYDIWQITEIATDTYDWTTVGMYDIATDSLVWE